MKPFYCFTFYLENRCTSLSLIKICDLRRKKLFEDRLKSFYQANICWSSRRLQHVFSVTILRLPRRLEDVLKTSCKDVLKTSWRPLARRLEDVLEDEKLLRWRRLEDVLKTLWRQAKYLLGISVSNKSKCVSSKSIFHKSISDKSKMNPKCVT